MDTDKDNLLYRPDLRPERDYLSDGSFKHVTDVPAVEVPQEKKDETPRQLYDDFQEIEEIINILPPEIHFLAKIVEKARKRIEIIYPEGYIPPEEEPEKVVTGTKLPDDVNHIGHTPIKSNPALGALPALFPQTNNVVLTVEQPKTLVQLVQNSYAKDQVELDKYYSQQLQVIMQQYFHQMLSLMNDCGASSIDDLTKDFDGEQVKIPAGKDLEHLRDYIVRSQVQRKQISRLFKKTHSPDKMLMHMRAWHAAEAQRERYYGENYKDSSTYTDSHSNSLLRESRSSYDNAYSSSFYSMYKFLNSSVMMTNEILNATVKEAQAKAELLKNGVDIYAVDPELEAFAAQATNSGQMGDGKGSGWNESSGDKKDGENADDKNQEKDTSGDGKTDTAENGELEKQYQNDLQYLKDNGYSEEDAKAELSKLDKYKDKSSDSSSNAGEKPTENKETFMSEKKNSGIFDDIAQNLEQTVVGGLTKIATAAITGKSVPDAAKSALKDVTDQLRSDIQATAQTAIGNVAGTINTTIDKIVTKQNDDVDKKNDASKYPVNTQFSDDDDEATHDEKRIAQIKWELTHIDAQIAEIRRERAQKGKSTYRHNDLVELDNQKKKLLQEYNQLTQ